MADFSLTGPDVFLQKPGTSQLAQTSLDSITPGAANTAADW